MNHFHCAFKFMFTKFEFMMKLFHSNRENLEKESVDRSKQILISNQLSSLFKLNLRVMLR